MEMGGWQAMKAARALWQAGAVKSVEFDGSILQGTVRGEGLAPEGTSYTVQKGDTLSHIAKAHYGRASKWKAIFDANRDQLDDPDRIQPGQVLQIPAIDLDGDGEPDAPR